MVLLAGFGVLVRRYTGAEDVLCSVPVTGRSAAAERAIGYFGNTLLLRMRVRSDDTFASWSTPCATPFLAALPTRPPESTVSSAK